MSIAASNLLRDQEIAFLEGLRAEYESKGYRFIVHPRLSDLPDFLATYSPDAVALRSDRNVAIEVKSRVNPASQQSLQRIRKLFDGHPDWQFTVAYMGSGVDPVHDLPSLSGAEILSQVRQVEELASRGSERAAFIFAWSLLEAALNSARPSMDKRPRTPGTVVQTLAMDGLVSAEMEESLRSLIALRNRAVHGDLTAEPSRADVDVVLSAVRAALS